jgi:hypothetical protein
MLGAGTLHAAIAAQMNLEEMVARADRVFTGEVLGVSEGRVAAGGGEVPTVTYRLKVIEAFKGEFDNSKGESIAEVTMVGTLKQILSGRHPITDFPILVQGGEYLLLVAPAGPTGLTTTMGLGQGAFAVTNAGNVKQALNGASNVGLFDGMDTRMQGGVPADYNELTREIRGLVGGTQ